MNITLREVYQTSPEGDKFWKLRECYIRGSTVGGPFPNYHEKEPCHLTRQEDQIFARP